MTILAIDPGLSGAWACISSDGLTVGDLPCADGKMAGSEFARLVRTLRPDVAVVEAVGAMPKQGVSSTWKFAEATGTIIGVLAACDIPLHRVAPTTWKKHFKLDRDKEASRALAMRLWPACTQFALKKHHGRAEAALIARFAATVMLIHARAA